MHGLDTQTLKSDRNLNLRLNLALRKRLVVTPVVRGLLWHAGLPPLFMRELEHLAEHALLSC
jgi:hypothetical protein